MSGTSLDGVDGVLVDFGETDDTSLRVLAHRHLAMPAALAAEFLALNTPGDNELHRAALAGNALAALQADAVRALLDAAGLPAGAVRAIGSHGQTLRHQPGAHDGTGYTWQVNQPALLAERTGIDVVADFRARDVAAGGQGAPLVPAFHAAVFASAAGVPRVVLNVGGIANLTVLPGAGPAGSGDEVTGFDTGPGNVLMDAWCQAHRGEPYDASGRWAASGRVHGSLLAAMLADPYFALPPPKSTGRDLFHRAWLADRLAALAASGMAAPSPADVQATLLRLTARSAADALRREAPRARELLVCGGGAFNDALMAALADELPGVAVSSTERAGLPPLWVEAAAFAWLARAHVERLPGNRPSVTGARGPRVLGALYPA